MELLRDHDSLTAGSIASRFPKVSRPAVSKHLGVLRQAHLVRAREQGRERHYSLDAGPLGEIYRAWLSAFAPHWKQSLERLKQQVEGQPDPES